MCYSDRGEFIGAEPSPDGDLVGYRRARDAAIAASEPFPTWWARHREEWRVNHSA